MFHRIGAYGVCRVNTYFVITLVLHTIECGGIPSKCLLPRYYLCTYLQFA